MTAVFRFNIIEIFDWVNYALYININKPIKTNLYGQLQVHLRERRNSQKKNMKFHFCEDRMKTRALKATSNPSRIATYINWFRSYDKIASKGVLAVLRKMSWRVKLVGWWSSGREREEYVFSSSLLTELPMPMKFLGWQGGKIILLSGQMRGNATNIFVMCKKNSWAILQKSASW